MPNKSSWQDIWLTQRDDNQHLVGDWLEKVTEVEGQCKVCKKTISIAGASGFDLIKQHSRGIKHQRIAKLRFGHGTSQVFKL